MKTPLKPLKKKAWALCSEYIRRKYADENGIARCISCNEPYHWKQLQAGHLVPGRCNSILFDERGIRPQCRQCNYQEGNTIGYLQGLTKELGSREEADKLADELHAQKNKTVKYSSSDYERLIDEYKTKLKELEGA